MTSTLYVSRLRAALGLRYSAHTIYNYLGQSERFLAQAGVKSAYSREDLLAYMDGLVLRGYKRGSITTILTAIRAMFDANDLAWPLIRRDKHLMVAEEEQGGPVLSHQEVAQLILATRQLGPPARPAVALSTVYALRAQEIAAVFGAGCGGKLLEVQTAKAGRRRSHAIPPELAAALMVRPKPITPDGLHKLFERLMLRYVRPPRPGEGFHAVRRAVVTGLLDADLSEYQVHRWMGWQAVSKTSYRYYRPDPVALDTAVYRVHPFLPYWREGRQ